MAERLASLIDRRGESVGIYRRSSGAVDAYGDAAVTWGLQASEDMLVKVFDKSMLRGVDVSVGVAGRLKDVEKLAYAKSSSVVVAEDYLLVAGEKWRVVYVAAVKVGDVTRLKIACLSRFD